MVSPGINFVVKMYCNNLFEGVNTISDPRNPSDLERRHIPVIDSPDKVKIGESFTVTAEIGRSLSHPSDKGHFVEFIDLYADEMLLARVKFNATSCRPKATLEVTLHQPAGELRVLGKCNLHGVWAGSRSIEIIG